VNRVEPIALPEVSARAAALHRESSIVDLHADSLLFGRDLRKRTDKGHVDLPRLREGNVMLQVFGVATSAPLGINIERNEPPGLDLIALGYCVLRLEGCRGGPPVRFGTQLVNLAYFADDPTLIWVRTAADLERLRAAHAQDPRVIGAMLGIEGAYALAGGPDQLNERSAKDIRMIGLAHFFDDDYAGSAHGVAKGGLTELGRRTIARMEELGILVDVAHLSPAAIDDVLAMATKPVLSSHGGVKGTCDNARTLSDAHVRGIAATGGVVGIGYWKEAVCGTAPADVARAIRYTVDLVGDEHVALGSDYDGGTTVSFDASQLAVLTQALLDAGLSEASVRRVLGENALRVLAATLPR
jgi:membrane dipeptidase